MESETRLYKVWENMKSRCYNKRSNSYNNYGGRGITMCDSWKENYNYFKEWAIENGYSDELSIDRIDVNGNYEPSNCRWATPKEQANNKRNNVFITYKGITHTVAEWSDITGVSRHALASRIKSGYSDGGDVIFGIGGQNRLKSLRTAHGLTQGKMAVKLNTSRENIANYEAGRREPSAEFYQKLQKKFNVSDTFIGGVVLEFAIKKRIASKND